MTEKKKAEKTAALTSLPALVRRVFEAIKPPPPPDNKTAQGPDRRPMHAVWAEVFGAPKGLSPYYERLAWLVTAIEKIDSQVSSCPQFSDDSKAIYKSILKGLHGCVSPKFLNTQCHEMQSNFSKEKLQLLTLMSDTLVHFTPQATLTVEGVSDVEAAIKELEELLKGSEINADLKEILDYHIKQMRFAVEHIEFYGIEPLFDHTGRALVIVQRAREATEVPNSSADKWAKIKTTATRIYSILESADRYAKTFESHFHRISGAFDTINSLLPGNGN